MPERTQRFAVALPIIVAACSLTACPQTSGNGAGDGARNAASARSVADRLDRQTADSRKARIADVRYELYLDIHGGNDRYSGELTASFTLNDASKALIVDFGGGRVNQLVVNGRPLRPDYNGFFLTLPAETLQQGANSVFAAFEHPYSEDGTGLHRFTDPVDGRHYLYTYLWPYYANRLFPSFDQPNLKAEIALTVRAPEKWTVVSASAGKAEPSNDGSALWRFNSTPKMSTYVFSVHAGPYKIWQDDAEGVPIRLMARQSLAEFVAVDEWLDVTKSGLRFYGRYFDIPYPFEKYDQLIVPDFNIGAMENIGAVAFAERYVQRQESDRAERESRARVILHEMAHMWFGNLVTHDWWNGLWLNESFATQMAAMAAVGTTEFKDTWHGFFTDEKKRAYRKDGLVTTHPIEVPVNSTADFFSVFDAITYQKGSSVLKQLAHYVGEEKYRRGVSAYLKEHLYGTTELADFIRHQEAGAGVDLERWSGDWLYKPGFNTLGVRLNCEDDRLRSLTIVQTAPLEHPYLRQHQLDVALYNVADDGELLAGDVISLRVAGAETAVDLPEGLACPVIVNPNHNDWAFVRISLDDRTASHVGEYLHKLPEPLTRSIFLAALFDVAAAGDMRLADFVGHATRLAEQERNVRVLQQASAYIVEAVDLMQRLRPETDAALARIVPEIEELSLKQAANEPASDIKRIWFNTFAGVVSTRAGLDEVGDLLDGTTGIQGLEISADLRWQLLVALSRYGGGGVDERLAAEAEADASDFGVKSTLTARAAMPDKAQKAKWLAELRNPRDLTGLAKQRAVMLGLFPSNQTALQLEFLDEVLDALQALSETADPYFVSSYVSSLLTPMCVAGSAAKMQAALAGYVDDSNSTARRFLREAHQADSECLALRSAQ